MLSIKDALAQIFALLSPIETEDIALEECGGRVLRKNGIATRAQPPFAASAMDGYGVIGRDAKPGARLKVIGHSVAGKGFDAALSCGQAVQIFTGAPVPSGVERIIIQEDVSVSDTYITLANTLDSSDYIRPAGMDFTLGATLTAPRRLSPADLSLLAAMNIPTLCVARRPRVAIISTGNELLAPGETPGPDQIIASNGVGVKARLEAEGAQPHIMAITRDTISDLKATLARAQNGDLNADLIVTLGGASVGQHDLVRKAATEMGFEQSFYKIAMRPGKPLMAGRLGKSTLIGLPGNPVSALVCCEVFLVPAIRASLGLPGRARRTCTAMLTSALDANGARAHYMRAKVKDGRITPFERQDSALLSILSQANALLLRPPNQTPLKKGGLVEYIRLA